MLLTDILVQSETNNLTWKFLASSIIPVNLNQWHQILLKIHAVKVEPRFGAKTQAAKDTRVILWRNFTR